MTSKPIYMKAIYVVRSSTPGIAYDVEVDTHGGWYCDCADYLHRGQYLPIGTCKHIRAKQAELLAKEIAVVVKAPSPVGSKSRLEMMYDNYRPE